MAVGNYGYPYCYKDAGEGKQCAARGGDGGRSIARWNGGRGASESGRLTRSTRAVGALLDNLKQQAICCWVDARILHGKNTLLMAKHAKEGGQAVAPVAGTYLHAATRLSGPSWALVFFVLFVLFGCCRAPSLRLDVSSRVPLGVRSDFSSLACPASACLLFCDISACPLFFSF